MDGVKEKRQCGCDTTEELFSITMVSTDLGIVPRAETFSLFRHNVPIIFVSFLQR